MVLLGTHSLYGFHGISEYSKKVVRSINNDERPFILIDSSKKKSSLYESNNKMVTKKKLIFL